MRDKVGDLPVKWMGNAFFMDVIAGCFLGMSLASSMMRPSVLMADAPDSAATISMLCFFVLMLGVPFIRSLVVLRIVGAVERGGLSRTERAGVFVFRVCLLLIQSVLAFLMLMSATWFNELPERYSVWVLVGYCLPFVGAYFSYSRTMHYIINGVPAPVIAK